MCSGFFKGLFKGRLSEFREVFFDLPPQPLPLSQPSATVHEKRNITSSLSEAAAPKKHGTSLSALAAEMGLIGALKFAMLTYIKNARTLLLKD